ncbi:MAG: TIGR00730 family Rossman fold protein [Pseudomonadota bacterium]
MTEIKSICVYCGSQTGNSPVFTEAARETGKLMAMSGVSLVYGGGDQGVMGAVSQSVLEHGGKVKGIIPNFLLSHERRNFTHIENFDMIVTENMHERKRLMFEHSDAFLTLPGGIGTLEEVVEMITWAQLGRHKKPVLLADIGGFWGPLTELLDHMIAQGFITDETMIRYLVTNDVSKIVPKLQAEFETLSKEALEGDDVALARL